MYKRKTDFQADLDTAADPATDGEQLEKLLDKHYGEFAMAEALARHPQCPFQLFIKLWRWGVRSGEDNPTLEQHRRHQRWEEGVRRSPTQRYSQYNWDVSPYKPQNYQLRYIMAHGEGAYQRWAMSLSPIPEELIRAHVGSKSAPLRKTFAARDDLPPDLSEQLAGDRAKSVRQVLAANRMAPPEIIGKLASDSDPAVADAARGNPRCPEQALHLARLADASQTAAPTADAAGLLDQCRSAADPATDTDQLTQYSEHKDPCIRFHAGINPSTPAYALTRLAADPVDWVRTGPAFNPSTPASVLTGLLGNANAELQIALASNPSLPQAEQLRLADSAGDAAARTLANLTRHPAVWEHLTRGINPATAGKRSNWRYTLALALAARSTGKFATLQRGIKTRHLFVSRVAARADTCPDNLAPYYAHYLFEDYAQNPKAALALLEGGTHVQPAKYKDWKVDKWLSEGDAPGHVSDYYIRSDHPKRRAQAVSNWTTQIVHLLPFMLDPNTNIRKRLALRNDLPRCFFELLARDEKPGVREAVASNKRTPKALLTLLAGDQATTVEHAAARRNPKTPAPTAGQQAGKTSVANRGSATDRARLAKRSEDPKLLTELASDRATSVRKSVAENRHTPAEVLSLLAKDKDAKVRTMVANRSRDQELLTSLLDDPEQDVRVAAAKNGVWRRYRERQYHHDQDFLARIADARDPELRALTARYGRTPDLYQRYLDETSVEVLRALGQNQYLSADFKRRLARQVDDQDTVAHLARKTEDEELFLIAASKITSVHACDPIRCHGEMLSRPTVQDALCRHPVSNVRYALTNQKNLTEQARAALAEDEFQDIRKRVTSPKS